MNKVKNFFFNKIEKGKSTSFYELIISFILGAGKIFILLMLNGVIIILIMPNNSNNKYFLFFQIISITIFLSILIYILINRIPNQIIIIKNYLNTKKHKNSEVSKVMITEKTTNLENLNFDNFKEQIYFKNGKKDVHYTFEQLEIKGNLYTTDLIWFEGLKNWTKVSEIIELSHIALSKPPLTEKEKNILCFKNSLKPTLIIYLVFSLFLGVSAGFLEKYQYDIFFEEVNANYIQNQIDEDALTAKKRREYLEYQHSINKSKPSSSGNNNMNEIKTIDELYSDLLEKQKTEKTNTSTDLGAISAASRNRGVDLSSYSSFPSNEVYVTNDDGTRFTRWSSYLAVRGTDQEQISYNENHSFLFRPYQAIIKHVNLSKNERENIALLLSNFVLSALVTNLLLLPFLIMIIFLKNRKKV